MLFKVYIKAIYEILSCRVIRGLQRESIFKLLPLAVSVTVTDELGIKQTVNKAVMATGTCLCRGADINRGICKLQLALQVPSLNGLLATSIQNVA